MTHSWFRVEGEGTQAFDAFQHYLFLEPRERSLDKAFEQSQNQNGIKTVSKKPKRRPNQWGVWSQKFKWVERAQAYDDHLAAAQFIGAQEVAMAQAKVRALERERITSLERELADALVERAREMLRQPVVRKTAEKNEDGKIIGYIIEPMKWTARDIVSHIEAADKLYRLSVGLHTDSTRVDISTVLGDTTNYVLDVAAKTLPTEWYDQLESALSK